jgi:hypothetical protein
MAKEAAMSNDKVVTALLEQMSIEDAIRIVSAICTHFQIPAVHLFQQGSDGRIMSVTEEPDGGGPTLARLSISGFPDHMSAAIAAAISGGTAVHGETSPDPLNLSYGEASEIINKAAQNTPPKKPNAWGLPSKRPN